MTLPDDAAAGEAVDALYHALLDAWNRRDAAAYAELFAAEGLVVGFDGSEMRGPEEIGATLARIFADHPTGRCVAKVRGVERLAADVALLRAVAGMVPHGRDALEPALHAVQVMAAVRLPAVGWRVALFQNTPAAYHGRPQLRQQLTEELSGLLPGA